MDFYTFKSDGLSYNSATPYDGQGRRSPLHQLSDCDLIDFIAIAQGVDVTFVDVEWHQGLGPAGRGASASIQQSLANSSTSLAFKQIQNARDASSAYKIALAEILILQHPLIRSEENIIDLYGVGWNVSADTGEGQLVPVLVYPNAAQYGNLHQFMWNSHPDIQQVIGEYVRPIWKQTFENRLALCVGIGKAIQAMHSCNIIHGDIKPENILIFPETDGSGFVPKVIDFGYSVYGFEDYDLVNLPCTEEWMAPEWHHRAFSVQDAKKVDIYCFAEVCDWLLTWNKGRGIDLVFPKNRTRPHLARFRQVGLCEDPSKRTGNISLLISMLLDATKTEGGSFFEEILQRDPQGLETHFSKYFGKEGATEMMKQQHRNVQRLSSGQSTTPCQSNDILGLLSKEFPRTISLSKDLLDFQSLHFSIRIQIKERLLKRSADSRNSPKVLEDMAFQLALCYEVAFGTGRDLNQSQKWLCRSGRNASDLLADVSHMRSSEYSRQGTRAIILDSTSIDTMYRDMVHGELNDAIDLYNRESEGKLVSLGLLAAATIGSYLNLISLLEMAGRLDEAIGLTNKILDACEKEWGQKESWARLLRLRLSRLMATLGNFPEAILLGEDLLQTETGTEDQGSILQALATYYGRICDFKRSTEYIRQVWDSRKIQYGKTHPYTMDALELLAYAMTDVNMTEAEAMETEVFNWRRRVLGEKSDIVLETMRNLAFVRANTKGKELEGIEMQQDVIKRLSENPVSQWTRLVWATDRLAWMQERESQLNEAIETRAQLLPRMSDLLSCGPGLAFLGNHAGDLKSVGRVQEARALSVEVLQRVPVILKPVSHNESASLRGIARAYQVDHEFDKEVTVIYFDTLQLKQKFCEEIGELHPRTASVSRFLRILYNEGFLVQCSIQFLGLEHTTTRLAIVRLKNVLSTFLGADDEFESHVSDAMIWIEKRLAAVENE